MEPVSTGWSHAGAGMSAPVETGDIERVRRLFDVTCSARGDPASRRRCAGARAASSVAWWAPHRLPFAARSAPAGGVRGVQRFRMELHPARHPCRVSAGLDPPPAVERRWAASTGDRELAARGSRSGRCSALLARAAACGRRPRRRLRRLPLRRAPSEKPKIRYRRQGCDAAAPCRAPRPPARCGRSCSACRPVSERLGRRGAARVATAEAPVLAADGAGKLLLPCTKRSGRSVGSPSSREPDAQPFHLEGGQAKPCIGVISTLPSISSPSGSAMSSP